MTTPLSHTDTLQRIILLRYAVLRFAGIDPSRHATARPLHPSIYLPTYLLKLGLASCEESLGPPPSFAAKERKREILPWALWFLRGIASGRAYPLEFCLLFVAFQFSRVTSGSQMAIWWSF